MDPEQKATFADTHIFDEDVMDEMESADATQVLHENLDELAETRTQENKFLDEFEAATVVLNNGSPGKKAG